MAENGGSTADERPGDEPESRPPTDSRQHRGRTERNLIIGGFGILFVVGGGLAWLLYGPEAFVGSWLCLGSGAALLVVLYKLFREAG